MQHDSQFLRLALPTLAAAFALSPALASAADHSVCASSCDFSSIQAAVDDPSTLDGDAIVVLEDRVESVEVLDKELTIRFDWTTRRTLDADGADHALSVQGSGSVTVWGLDITGASTAGVYVEPEATLRLRNTMVYGNVGTYGAALNLGHLITRDGTLITGNESTSFFAGGINNYGIFHGWGGGGTTYLFNHGYKGGAFANIGEQAIAQIHDSSFTGNTAYIGGAVHNSWGDVELTGSSFSSNYADSLGGAWSNHNIGGSVTDNGSDYAGNSTGSGSNADCYDVNGGCTP